MTDAVRAPRGFSAREVGAIDFARPQDDARGYRSTDLGSGKAGKGLHTLS